MSTSAKNNCRVDLCADGTRRLVATKQLAPGDLALYDEAFLITWDTDPLFRNTYHYQSWCLVHRLLEHYPKKTVKEVRQQFFEFSSLFPKLYQDRAFCEDVLACFNAFQSRGTMADIVELWAMVATVNLQWWQSPTDPSVRRGGAGLFLRAAFVNHSCDPNVDCEYKCTKTAAKVMLRALRPIAEGEEICMAYMSLQPGLPAAARQQYIKSHFGFDCACSLCVQK